MIKDTEISVEVRLRVVESFLVSELGMNSASPGNVNRAANERETEADARFKRIEHAYFGNGVMGDRTRVAILWYGYSVIAGLLGTIIGFFLNEWMT